MQIQNPWVDKLYFGSPTSSQYIEVTGGDIQINSDLRISSASNDDALTRLLAWDPSTNIIKYRNSSSISGGGSGSQGFQGSTGSAGSDSVITSYYGTWQTTPTLYGVNEWVNYGGSTWFSNNSNSGSTPSLINSDWTIFSGAGLIVGTSIPSSSSATGSKGEIRVDIGQSLYIHDGNQWLRFSITASTF